MLEQVTCHTGLDTDVSTGLDAVILENVPAGCVIYIYSVSDKPSTK